MIDDQIQPVAKKRGRKPVDLSGRQYGWLVPLYALPREGAGQTLWMCLCTASHQAQRDRERLVPVRYSALADGRARSCGCRQRTVRMELDPVGHRPIYTECDILRNEFIAYGVVPAPEWAKTRDEIEHKVIEGFDANAYDDIDRELFGDPEQTNGEG